MEEDPYLNYRRSSKGWRDDQPARVHPNIVFGAGNAVLDFHYMMHYNITHIINCAFNENSTVTIRDELEENYTVLYAIDSPHENILKWYTLFEYTMDKYLKDKTCKTVYVHCECGINRSAFLTIAYCCKRFAMDYELLVKAILRQRPCALTNRSFENQVKNFVKNNGEFDMD